ncbi:MAG: ribosome silencing factor [Alphaproteobacteria bacterium]|nr:MAG: ribosome silencing factor [Alphaproteobacteria bacterium]
MHDLPTLPKTITSESLVTLIVDILDSAKGQEIVTIPLKGKTSLADMLIVVTGTSDRHLGSMANRVLEGLREQGIKGIHVEGEGSPNWLLIDTNDVIVHLFRAESRKVYDIEGMWSGEFEAMARQAKEDKDKKD